MECYNRILEIDPIQFKALHKKGIINSSIIRMDINTIKNIRRIYLVLR